MIERIDAEIVHRYIEARRKIDESADWICCLSSVLSVFEEWGEDRVRINACALGKINSLINQHACRIQSALEDFIPLAEAEDLVEKSGCVEGTV